MRNRYSLIAIFYFSNKRHLKSMKLNNQVHKKTINFNNPNLII